MKEEFEFEEKKLEKTVEDVKRIKEQYEKSLDECYDKLEYADDDIYTQMRFYKEGIRLLKGSLDRPYFARIDFSDNENPGKQAFYIGKKGINEDDKIIVVDWRAPISTLYYDSNLGSVEYKSPSGMVKGDLELKRQFEIENAKLLDYFDVDLVSNDVLLQKYLNENNNSRVKTIVSTIQSEQNTVIRKDLNRDLIVQGVAGSGKTTVALHRIAYLVYTYRDIIKQNQFFVIGPNSVFLKYIKSVLPDLDVSGVEQKTYEQFTQDFIGEEIRINSSENKLASVISTGKSSDIDRFKCSNKYKAMIDVFLSAFVKNLFKEDLRMGEFLIIPKEEIAKIYAEYNNKFSDSLDARIEYTIRRMSYIIEKNIEKIKHLYRQHNFERFDNAAPEEKEKLRAQVQKENKEVSLLFRNVIKKYFSKIKTDTTKIYKTFVSTIENYDLFNYENIDELKTQTLKNLKSSKYDFEDLAALLYLRNRLSQNKNAEKIRHIVLDEAQDFGEFNFAVLKECFPNATFSIFGDIAQSIYSYRSISNWEDLTQSVLKDAELIQFNKSYRTTAEIMSVADSILEHIGYKASEMVIRHGEPVRFTKINPSENSSDYIIDSVQKFKNKGYKTIGIISKTDMICCKLDDALSQKGYSIHKVKIDDDILDDDKNICNITNQLSKGLEFDAIILNGADELIYNSKSVTDMKLLYVAITRALHEVEVLYSNELTKPLNEYLTRKCDDNARIHR